MNEPPDYLTSASYVQAIVRAVRSTGRFDEVLAVCGPEARRYYEAPHSLAWWPSSASLPASQALEQVGGLSLMREVGRTAVVESMSVVIRPLVSVLLAVSHPTPGTLLSKLGTLASAAVRNVSIEWAGPGPGSGTVTVVYPRPATPSYAAYWEGACEYVFTVTKRQGRVTVAEATPLRFVLDVAWD